MARARMGQHFLADPEAVGAIVASAAVRPSDRVVEIGPGRGALTFALSELTDDLTLVEPDRGLAATLRLGHPAARVLEKRGEDVDYLGLPGPLVVVANLPYYASVQIYKRLTEQKANVSRMVLMFQKEVAQRIAAGPGGRHYGSLSLWSAYNWTIETVLFVPRSSFRPPPKVESAVLRFVPRPGPPVEADEDKLFRLVRASFARRRRTLANNLKNVYSAGTIGPALDGAGLDPNARAETASMEQFAVMCEILREKGPAGPAAG
ncbi:MAG: ribosomal RNA small subunit methyltransferase A [Nitrospinae bacterium]|nr:ribosomal RNA small subunit methyltransferase A [Nitrospinota bacterium]